MVKNKIAVIGSGAMGTACAMILAENKHDVIIYGIDKEEINQLKVGKNTKYFDEETYLPHFNTTLNLIEALDNANYVLLAVPTKFMPNVYKDVIANLNTDAIIINVSKGFWPNTTFSMHEGLAKYSEQKKHIKGIVSLIGPSYATEIVKRTITLVSAVDNNKNNVKLVQKLFSNKYFRVYGQNDIKGAETGAIFKNMLAIANGMLEGLGYKINTQAALITRGLQEMIAYCKYVGGKLKTLFGLTGVGDLILTSLSENSRNYTYGKNFFKNKTIDTNITVEGLQSIKIIYENIIVKKILDLPIIEALYQIIYNQRDVYDTINDLLSRKLKNE
ncbi:NAD(P)H-dependent glycerol-3-phosphate dehydrogenase [Metamycoplasma buccale]|uniref:NAD(P)H-dependent glycerol-3-phosphate dehydrogenase n=1 Tax=Metamycoplasma buccale TaxID=55602 RepID=UPI00398F6ABC